MNLKYYIIVLLGLLFVSPVSNAQSVQLSDSAQISLLTNGPWDKVIYAVFGHTAIRVRDDVNRIDYAFNYGLFNYSSSNFIYRFVKGETDYVVGAVPFIYYLEEYNERGVTTIEQILNLDQSEKQKVWDALVINSLPENRMYRYNYFFDNCSTRPRDIVENSVEGTITYQPTNKEQTFRDLIGEFLAPSPWMKFGIDLVIGSGADRDATDREKMFLPIYLKDAYNGAVIKDKDRLERRLVAREQILNEGSAPGKAFPVTPMISGCLLLAITIVLSFLNFRNKGRIAGRIFDTILFLIAGLAGCVIAFLFFFSEHPCVDSNWNIIWLNPIQLLAAILIFVKFFSKYIYWYHFINFALLSLFILCWWLIPQQLELAFIPFILSLCLRSGTNFVTLRRKN